MNRQNKRQSTQGIMTKQTYVILGVILITVLVLAGAVLVREKRQESVEPITPPAPTPTQPTSYPLQPTYSSSTPEGWKTYRNEEFGFELEYPGEWFVYDKAKWEEDEKIESCNIADYMGYSPTSVMLSTRNLGRCVGFGVWESWKGDIIIDVTKNKFPNFPYVLGREDVKIMNIAGETASKYSFTEKSDRPRKQATRIYVVYKDKNYIIEFNQIDNKGNYDPIFDKILSTFRFLK